MARNVLQNIQIEKDSNSYINCLHAVLSNCGLFEGPKYLLSGMTGMAFKFTIEKGISPRSVHAYGPWVRDNWKAVDNLGIYNSAQADRCRHRTFPLIQQKAIENIKMSIDKGIGVLYWCPPFGVIHGYDDEQRIFYYLEGDDFFQRGGIATREEKICLFDNICLNPSLIWFYQTFDEKIKKELKDIYLDSLNDAMVVWNQPPNSHSASGQSAYPYLINELETNEFHLEGAAYTLDTYATSKFEIYQYMNEVKVLYPELSQSSELFSVVHSIYKEIQKIIRYENRHTRIEKHQCKPINGMLKEAEIFENAAMKEIERFLNNQPADRQIDLFRTNWLQGDDR
ncbi:hypothetical protein ACFSO7_12935 [Bacillus sp. CGMCC 1.16607]|uniref:hypothetical protein n=1 Tax=Bacillus sp. CGMCC 1.16607 TaxID=3351842 RepID=UPI00363EB1F2